MADLDIVFEKTSSFLTVTFKDKNDANAAPNSATYRVDDVDTGASIRPATAMTPIAAVFEIPLVDTDNAMQGNRRFEKHRVTVEATYGSGDLVNAKFDYYVRNLAFA